MRINVKGNDISPEKIAAALAACERDYNLKITGATIYVRFENSSGQHVDPLQDGQEFSRDFWFQKRPDPAPAPAAPPAQSEPAKPVDLISAREMMELCQKAANRILSSPEMKRLIELEKTVKVDREIFRKCLDETMQNTRYFSVSDLVELVGYHSQ